MYFLTLTFPLPPFSHLPNKFYPVNCLHLCKISQIFSEIKWSSKEINIPKCFQVSFKIAHSCSLFHQIVYFPKQTVLQETENTASLCTLTGEKILLWYSKLDKLSKIVYGRRKTGRHCPAGKKAESNDSFVHSRIHAKVVSPGVPLWDFFPLIYV